MNNGLYVAGSKNPYRSLTPEAQDAREHPWTHPNQVNPKYPSQYKGYTVDYVDSARIFLKVVRPDGTQINGQFTNERALLSAIDADIIEQERRSQVYIRKNKYAEDETPRT